MVAGREPTGGGTQALSVRIVSPDSGATRPEGSRITIHADVTDPNDAVVRVDFYDDNRLIGSKSKPPYTLSTGRLKAGTYVLCDDDVDVGGNPSASPPVTLFVVLGDGDDDDDKKDDD